MIRQEASRTRHRVRRAWGSVAALAALIVLTAASPATAAVSFSKGQLTGTSLDRPTSLQFGPDGRLYVSQQQGLIKSYAVTRSASGAYSASGAETINLINQMPNRNDDGAVNGGVTGRLVTGILVTGSAAAPVIYVASSDPRIGAGETKGDLNLDTNSGILSKLTKTGSGWVKQDLVRGLPRSEENHTANGLALSPDGTKLYLAQGGNTNNGATSNNFAFLPEYALSAAVLSVDLTAIGAGTYDLPTLDDETRAGTADANDPFGGNDGKNQAKLVPGGPVQVHAPGMRNPYDVVVTEAGKMFTIDNGGNSGWGAPPVGEGPGGTCTNAVNEPGTTNEDELFDITAPGTYGGHPNPTRANLANTFNDSNPQSPVSTANPIECDFRDETNSGSLAFWTKSTNGLAEYTASNFGGEMKGDLLAAGFGNTIERVQLSGSGASTSTLISSAGGGGGPLDVVAQGDDDVFPGTIWYVDIYDNGVYVLEPASTGCDLSQADADGDGYTNADETAAGTDPCSPADVPSDADGDKVSDVTDANDDNDSLPDTSDPFALDAANGLNTKLPVEYLWENDSPSAGGILNLGFTGLMSNGSANYATQFDTANMTAGGAAGVVTVDAVDGGDAYQTSNKQKYGFQFGVSARPAVGPFTVHTRIMGPFNGITPGASQSMGMFIGTGDQDNYVKVVTAYNGIEALREVGGSATGTKVPMTFPGPGAVDLYLRVDPAAGTVHPSFTTTTGGTTSARQNVGDAITVPTGWFTAGTGLAVGVLSTSIGAAPPFPATWDFLRVIPENVPTTTTPPAGGSGPGPVVESPAAAPSLSRLAIASRSFRRMLRMRFSLSEAARVRVVFYRATSGRRIGARCLRPMATRSSAPRCRRYVRVSGAVSRNLQAGRKTLRLRPRVGGRRLRPATYRLVVTATDAQGNRSRTRNAKVRVLP